MLLLILSVVFLAHKVVVAQANNSTTTLTKIRLSSFYNTSTTLADKNVTLIKLLWLTSSDKYGNNFWDFQQSVGAVNVALQRIANEHVLSSVQQYDLEVAHAAVTLFDGCSTYGDLHTIDEIYHRMHYKFDAVVGPPCAEGSLSVSTFAESVGRPHILWLGSHQDYDMKQRYPHIVQTSTDVVKVVECFFEFLRQVSSSAPPNEAAVSVTNVTNYFGRPWRRVAFISDSDSTTCKTLIWPTFQQQIKKKLAAESLGLFMAYGTAISGRKATDEQIRDTLLEVRKVARIIITCTSATGGLRAFGPPQKYDFFNLRIVSQAYRLGMVGGGGGDGRGTVDGEQQKKNDPRREYQWIQLVVQFSNHQLPPYAPALVSASDFASANFSMQPSIDELNLTITESELYDAYKTILMFDQDWGAASDEQFSQRIIEAAFRPPWNVNRSEFEQNVRAHKQLGRASVFAPYLADAVYLYVLAVKRALTSGVDFRSSTVMYNILRNITFAGESGGFAVTSEGKRLTDLIIYTPVHDYYQQHPLKRFEARGVMQCASLSAEERAAGRLGYLNLKTPLEWFGTADGLPPRDTPICGFNNELCPLLSPGEIIAIACAGAVLVVASTVALYFWRRRHLRLAALLNTDWNLQAHDLTWPQSELVRRQARTASGYSPGNNNKSNASNFFFGSMRSDISGGDGLIADFAASLTTINTNAAQSPTSKFGGGRRRSSVATTMTAAQQRRRPTLAKHTLVAVYKNQLRVHVKPMGVPARFLTSSRATIRFQRQNSTVSKDGGSGSHGSGKAAHNNMTLHVSSLPLECLKELRAMKDLDSEYINRFVGIVVDDVASDEAIQKALRQLSMSTEMTEQNLMLVATAFCSKGSLDNILYGNDGGQQQQQQLDWLFKYSFMCDIAAGLAYLHAASALKWHGRLRTRTVLLDARWTCKLADYGLWSFNDNSSTTTETNSQKQEEKLLWTAPEVLRSPAQQQESSTSLAADVLNAHQAADVYSFGVILSEIIYQVAPYHHELETDGMDIDDIINKIKKTDENTARIRPINTEFPSHTIPDLLLSTNATVNGKTPAASTTEVHNTQHRHASVIAPLNTEQHTAIAAAHRLMVECWAEVPTSRPNVKNIVRRLRQINGRSNNSEQSIVDRVIAKLETYAENLEGIVRERTGELLEEQARADALLSRMLPASVARALKHGEPVVPEQYDEATVFFSDVVSFTTIASLATPMQVVQLLNDLYTFMDTTLDAFAPNVYKVETIGDAYMVVSGVPLRTPNHARIMASMALAILANITRVVRVPLLQCSDALDAVPPPKSVQLRVGLNSGACVAGVVGLAMPRYCLFGDTVNVASRMESNSEAMRVHISASTRASLSSWSEYACLDRGVVNIKGKGEMHTYWLVDGPTAANFLNI